MYFQKRLVFKSGNYELVIAIRKVILFGQEYTFNEKKFVTQFRFPSHQISGALSLDLWIDIPFQQRYLSLLNLAWLSPKVLQEVRR